MLEKAFEEVNRNRMGHDKLFSQICRALIITYNALINFLDSKKEKSQEEALKNRIKVTMDYWESELPEDEFMKLERRRVQYQYPKLINSEGI